MTVSVWVYIRDGGDGSASAHFFNSEEEAEEYAVRDEEFGTRFGDDIQEVTLEFDKKGNLSNPSVRDDD